MEPWQDSLTSNSKRLSHIYRSGEMSDVAFTVGRDGENKKCFRAHKLILSMQSDVFFTMFYGSLPEKDHVEIIDVNPAVFEIVMKYAYEDSFLVQSLEEAMETYCVAEKYNIAHLRQLCATYITARISTENIPILYTMPNVLETLKIRSRCDEILSEETSVILGSEDFLNYPLGLVESIVKLDQLDIESEAELFEAVLEWAKSAVSEPMSELRMQMDKFLPHIRFLAMNAEEFVSGPAKSGILTDSEQASILENLALPGCRPLPSWCNKSLRTLLHSSRIAGNHSSEVIRETRNNFGYHNERYCSFSLTMTKGILKFRGISFHVVPHRGSIYPAIYGGKEPKVSLSVNVKGECRALNENGYKTFCKITPSDSDDFPPCNILVKCILRKPFIMNCLGTEYIISLSVQGFSLKRCCISNGDISVNTRSCKLHLNYISKSYVYLYEIFYN